MKSITSITSWFSIKKQVIKDCDHRFRIEDVVNKDVDPVCVYCRQTMSTISKIKVYESK